VWVHQISDQISLAQGYQYHTVVSKVLSEGFGVPGQTLYSITEINLSRLFSVSD
jgi:hypothetical protein